MANILNKLTEGIVNRSVEREGQALLDKWTKTGLLEGLDTDHKRQSMAVLLENQAKELLREANSMGGSGGDVQGFAAVSFPIVRRVFGGLLANDLVSVQPMSLPSGLIFFLDFTRGDTRGDDKEGESVHGQGIVGSEITEGVDISGANADKGFYNLSQGYSHGRGASTFTAAGLVVASYALTTAGLTASSEAGLQDIDYDMDLVSEAADGTTFGHVSVVTWTNDLESVAVANRANSGDITNEDLADSLNIDASGSNAVDQFSRNSAMTFSVANLEVATVAGCLKSTYLTEPGCTGASSTWAASTQTETLARRLTKATFTKTGYLESIRFVVVARGSAQNKVAAFTDADVEVTYGIKDNITEVSGGLGALSSQPIWELESSLTSPFGDPYDGQNIPEIDIKVDSVAITAATRKLKAKWTPELGQDLNAYHNLDAEVELTSVLSEQIALEIDQEILKDLVTEAKAGTRFWSRKVGSYISDQVSGASTSPSDSSFTGTVSEWYETLIETVNDVSAQIHRKTLRGGANFLVCGPETANILEFTSGFRASVTHDDDKGTVGGYKDGSINKKWDLYVDPYFPRNVILVGRKGSSFLESGYVYAPYVPLQTTPTIFGPEDFTPRKGVMTRYGKKMVRPDMYGLVIVRDIDNR